ncbi:vancomycin resistance protein VanW [Anaerobacterium chartisolvens]|uniref:Vancomycin resistance protein VanW n=1 Tax=Anaerobacterium chartisolvens TaxID=1297424 RepID=A0A369AT87_9FIRM|nr:VanW family protein [Anaerobacterium chartisolvens]RCX12193.1 vancomycin resistance protein VanW [Anaerobacterium chartisolvens]
MKRKLFCEISPVTYKISVYKCLLIRIIKNLFIKGKFAKTFLEDKLPYTIYKHKSLIRRKLGNVDMHLQENKVGNLSLAVPKINGILIYPGKIFSFWELVGNLTSRKGYKEGLVISNGRAASGVGGGMCQLTNLIHWMVLHTPMKIIEHHHHDDIDLFQDFNRQIPFGTGTSIVYNYLDYRFINNTHRIYQLITYTTDEYLCGEMRSNSIQTEKYHIFVEDEHFEREGNDVFRCGKVYRSQIDVRSGSIIEKALLKSNHAKVMYDTSNL